MQAYRKYMQVHAEKAVFTFPLITKEYFRFWLSFVSIASKCILCDFNQDGIIVVQVYFLVNRDVFCTLWQFDNDFLVHMRCDFVFLLQINAYFYGDANQLRKSNIPLRD